MFEWFYFNSTIVTHPMCSDVCCYPTGHRRWEIWCHSSFRRRVKPLQHLGQSPASYRHLCYGQLFSLHAWQCGAVGRCQRGGIWRCHKSSAGDLRRPSLWFLRTRLSVWKHSRHRGNPHPNTALGNKDSSKKHVYVLTWWIISSSILLSVCWDFAVSWTNN